MNLQDPSSKRVFSIDLLRGIVMVIMALDHVRDFLHVDAFTRGPLDPATTYGFLYFTRWITHFCAPIFVFLAGTSAYLVGVRRTKAELRRLLITRGLWLILIEVVVMSFAFSFDPLYHVIILQVIWCIGISFILLGLLVALPLRVIFLLGALIVLGHNLLDFAEAARKNQVSFIWHLLHNPGKRFYPFAKDHAIFLLYPFLPWTGILLLGYCCGWLYRPGFAEERRRRILVNTGVGALVIFVLLRWLNKYGDPNPWESFPTPLQTFYSFMNVTKYPPSLLYTCATLGPGLIFLGLAEKVRSTVARFFVVYGRVPFFYYVIHFFLIHLITVVVFFASGYGLNEIKDPQTLFLFRPLHLGFSLPVVYLIWMSIIAALYPLCRWFGNYKASHKAWWLSYI